VPHKKIGLKNFAEGLDIALDKEIRIVKFKFFAKVLVLSPWQRVPTWPAYHGNQIKYLKKKLILCRGP